MTVIADQDDGITLVTEGSTVKAGGEGLRITVTAGDALQTADGKIIVYEGGSIRVNGSVVTFPEGGAAEAEGDRVNLPEGTIVQSRGKRICIPAGGGIVTSSGDVLISEKDNL